MLLSLPRTKADCSVPSILVRRWLAAICLLYKTCMPAGHRVEHERLLLTPRTPHINFWSHSPLAGGWGPLLWSMRNINLIAQEWFLHICSWKTWQSFDPLLSVALMIFICSISKPLLRLLKMYIFDYCGLLYYIFWFCVNKASSS